MVQLLPGWYNVILLVTEEKLTTPAHQFVRALSTAEDSKTKLDILFAKSKEATTKTKAEALKTKTGSEETKSEEMTLKEAEATLSMAEELVKEATSEDEKALSILLGASKFDELKKDPDYSYSEAWKAEMKIVYESEESKKYVCRSLHGPGSYPVTNSITN